VRVLLRDLGDGDDDFFGLAAVLFGFGREEERGGCDVLVGSVLAVILSPSPSSTTASKPPSTLT